MECEPGLHSLQIANYEVPTSLHISFRILGFSGIRLKRVPMMTHCCPGFTPHRDVMGTSPANRHHFFSAICVQYFNVYSQIYNHCPFDLHASMTVSVCNANVNDQLHAYDTGSSWDF